MGFLERIAHTGVASSKDLVPRARQTRCVQFEFHQLIHIPEHQHITVELYDALILDERKRCKLAPAVVEARIVCVIFGNRRQKIRHSFLQNASSVKGRMALFRECVCIQSDERIL